MVGLVEKYLLAGGVSLGVTLLCVRPLMWMAKRAGLVDTPGGRRTHGHPTPLCGGMAIFIGLHLTVGLICLMRWDVFSGHISTTDCFHLFLASSLLLLLGLIDDRVSLSPYIKLLGQVAVATLLFIFEVRFGKMLGIPFHPVLSYLFTVLWFVGAMNAFNLIDGMDGLATGLGFIGALGLGILAIFTQQLSDALVMMALAGSCLGFLWFNFHPARAFLGDSGSMLIGLTLAWFSLKTNTKSPTLMALMVPMLAMGVPLLDVFLAVLRRSLRRFMDGSVPGSRTRLFVADRDHLHDRLRESGLSQRRAAGVLYAMAIALVAVGLLSTFYSSHRAGILMAAFAAFSYVVIRHLARVELWDGSRLAVRGLKKPPSVVMAVILYPLIDVLVLMVSFWGVVVLLEADLIGHSVKDGWRFMAPVAIGVPFLAVAFSRTYRRVWSRARISEYSNLMLWLVCGIASGSALLELLYGISTRAMFLVACIYLGLALPGIVLARAFPRLLQDSMTSLSRYRNDVAGGWTFLYGAGHTATLFIRQHVHRGSQKSELKILGFIDDDTNLRGRIVYDYPVLGGLDELESLMHQHAICRVIITHRIDDENGARIQALAEKHKFELQCWRPEVKTCFAPSAANRKGLNTG